MTKLNCSNDVPGVSTARAEVSSETLLAASLAFRESPCSKKRGSMKKIATTALLVFALLIAQIGQAQTVTTAAKPESPAKKPSPPTEINYTVTEAFPLGDRFIGALNRSGELALIGNFAASFVILPLLLLIRSARSQTLNA